MDEKPILDWQGNPVDLTENRCLICGEPVLDWKGRPSSPSHKKCVGEPGDPDSCCSVSSK